MDLFSLASEQEQEKNAPLARRMRPRNLDEYVGQEHIIGEGKMLRRAIMADRLGSLIFCGPTGSGKTALAEVIAQTTSSTFVRLNAVTAGVSQIREVVEQARDQLGMYGKRTILFVDEIHRFNKSQQDALLPYVEDGLLTLIGATTENPYVEVNKALISRSTIYRLEPLGPDQIRLVLARALEDARRGYGNLQVEVIPEAMDHLVFAADGDARRALNALELAVLTTSPGEDGLIRIGSVEAAESIRQKVLTYDKNGDQHYDVVSAFIKSMRASRPDAALHYMVRMLESGEDPRFVSRRMMIFASEDIGLADPAALTQATAADYALKNLGMPEAKFALTQACLYLALAPKSNACKTAVMAAVRDLEDLVPGDVPAFLQDKTYKKVPGSRQADDLYIYPPDHGYQTDQEYMPEGLMGRRYYARSGNGQETL